MATFFGEIVPSFSRAVDDDEDEFDSEETATTSVRWSPLVKAELLKIESNKLPCQALIVAIGPAASGFIQAYVLTDDFYIIGALFSGMEEDDVNTFDQMSPSDSTCFIYRSRSIPDAFVCLCKTEVSEEQSYSWTEQLFSCIETSSPLFYMSVLGSCMTSDYKSEVPSSELNPPFLRSLKTSRVAGTPVCKYLEQPNIVSGLPAELLSYCQMKDVRCVLYVCYTDSVYVDAFSLNVFKPLLASTPIKDLLPEKCKGDDIVKQIVEQYALRNTLYL